MEGHRKSKKDGEERSMEIVRRINPNLHFQNEKEKGKDLAQQLTSGSIVRFLHPNTIADAVAVIEPRDGKLLRTASCVALDLGSAPRY